MKKTIITALPILSILCSSLLAQQKADPYKKESSSATQKKETPQQNIMFCYEAFSLSISDAAELYRSSSSDTEIYQKILAKVQNTTAKQEIFTLLRSRSGERSSCESIVELTYPTEWLPSSSQTTSPINSDSANDTEPTSAITSAINPIIKTNPTPSSFETRNTGFTLEVEGYSPNKSEIIELRLSSEFVLLNEYSSWGSKSQNIKMPTFESQRTLLGANVRVNKPFLLGTFNQAPNSQTLKNSANTVWFAFMTVTLH